MWPSDKEQASAELLQHDDTLALVHTSKDDGDSAGGEGSPHFPHVSGKEVLGGARGSSVHSSDVVDKLLGTDYMGASILGASSFSSHRELGIFWQLLSYVGASSLMSQVFSKTYKGRTVL